MSNKEAAAYPHSLMGLFGLPEGITIPFYILLAISIILLIWQFAFTFVKVDRIKQPVEKTQ